MAPLVSGEADCFQRAGSAAGPLPGRQNTSQPDAAVQRLHRPAGRRGVQHASGHPGEPRSDLRPLTCCSGFEPVGFLLPGRRRENVGEGSVQRPAVHVLAAGRRRQIRQAQGQTFKIKVNGSGCPAQEGD